MRDNHLYYRDNSYLIQKCHESKQCIYYLLVYLYVLHFMRHLTGHYASLNFHSTENDNTLISENQYPGTA